MAIERSMGLVTDLLNQAQALAAVTARLRLDEDGVAGDQAQRAQMDRVIECLGAREHLEELTPEERSIVVSFARSYMRQALDLMDEPARAGAWSHSDPVLLQAQGSASAVVATLFLESGLGKPDARILDVGTGVAGLAMAFANAYPQSTIVGIDPWEPALNIARKNVADAGLGDRITLQQSVIEDLDESGGFDLAWLPSFFIPEQVIDPALTRLAQLLRPGGDVVIGVIEGPEDPLAGALDSLVTVRSGGSLLEPPEAVERLRRAGFTNAREVARTWKAPLRLVTGRRA